MIMKNMSIFIREFCLHYSTHFTRMGLYRRNVNVYYEKISDKNMLDISKLNNSEIIFKRDFSCCRTNFSDILHPFDPVYTNLIIENIYKEIQSWMCRRFDNSDTRQLSLLERATVLNRLMMTHCLDVLLMKECPFSKYETNTPEDEICLPAICAIIDKAKFYDVSSFIVGTQQYRKLDVLSKILDVSPENIFMNIMNCRNKISGMDTSVPYMEERKISDISVNLVGTSNYTSTIFPLTMGVTKAVQQLENDTDSCRVWPIICYDGNDIKDKSIYTNIIQTSIDKNFYIGGAIHLVFNEVEDELSMKLEKENQCKFLKVFADFLKSPIVHVKAEDIDSVVNAMHLAADFKNSYKRDIVINMMVSQTDCYPIKQLTLPELMEELVTSDKPPLAATYMRRLVLNNVISKTTYERRREEILLEIQQIYSRPSFVVVEEKKNTKINKFADELPTASSVNVLNTIGAAICKVPDNFKLSLEDSKSLDEREQQTKNNKLEWSNCELLAFGTLLQEETSIHICMSKKNKKPTLLITDSITGKKKNILSDLFPFMGNYTVCMSNITEYTMAGFEMGYSSLSTNSLNLWMVSENIISNVLLTILKHYLLYTVRNFPSRVSIVIPDYSFVVEKNTRKYQSTQRKQIVNVLHGMMDTKSKEPVHRCTIVNLSCPANYFHILRKQAKTSKMTPLIAYVPHLLKTSPDCYSKMTDLSNESCFQPFLPEILERDDSEVTQVILCSGKIYYDLLNERNIRNLQNEVAIGRIEQIYPLPMNDIMKYLKRHKKAKVWWAQQEQYEDGWWNYIVQSLKAKKVKVWYSGRCHATKPDYASPDLSEAELSFIFETVARNK